MRNLMAVSFAGLLAGALLPPAAGAAEPVTAFGQPKAAAVSRMQLLAHNHCTHPPLLKNADAAIAQERLRLTKAGWRNIRFVARIRNLGSCTYELLYLACRRGLQSRVTVRHINLKRDVVAKRAGTCPPAKK